MHKHTSARKDLRSKRVIRHGRKPSQVFLVAKGGSDLSFDLLWYHFVRDVASECPTLATTVHLPNEDKLSLVSDLVSQAETTLAWGGIKNYTILRQAEALLSKNASIGVGDDASRERNALDRFASSEARCRRTNRRLRHYGRYLHRAPGAVGEVLNRARYAIHRALPELTTKLVANLVRSGGFGPGTSFGTPGVSGRHLMTKLTRRVTYTEGALPYIFLLRKTHPRLWDEWNESGCRKVEGNRLAFVPKNATTHRTIAVEPLANTFILKGVEHFFKKRILPKMGVYLWDQSFNSDLCRDISISGRACTIDLSAASDTVSVELVRFLLPSTWFTMLDDLRSHSYKLDDGVWRRYEKFSSMGNAMTFPLESLIFKALADAAVSYCGANPGLTRCYGDDIIVPREAALLLTEVLEFCGFSTNREKSCYFGPFRETCGSDFVSGVPVRPAYLRDIASGIPGMRSTLILHNALLFSPIAPLLKGTIRYLRGLYPDAPIGPSSIDGEVAPLDQYYFGNPPSTVYHRDYQSYGWKTSYLGGRNRELKDERLIFLLRCSLRPEVVALCFMKNGSSNLIPQQPRLHMRTRWVSSWLSIHHVQSLYWSGALPSLNKKPLGVCGW